MTITPLARAAVVVLGVLGLGIQGRILLSPKQWTDVARLWEASSLVQKPFIVAALAAPACFYILCIGTCFLRLSKPTLLKCAGVISITALPLLLDLRDQPTIAKNAFWTAVAWLFVFVDQLYAKPTGRDDSTPATHEEEDRDTK